MPSSRFLTSLQAIPATDWDALHDGRNPFLSRVFLSELEEHGCLRGARYLSDQAEGS